MVDQIASVGSTGLTSQNVRFFHPPPKDPAFGSQIEEMHAPMCLYLAGRWR